MLRLKKVQIFSISAILLAGVLGLGFWRLLEPARGAAAGKINFKIQPGDGLKEISRGLKNLGVIKSEAAFKIYSIVTSKNFRFQPGGHEVSYGRSTPEIIRILTAMPRDIEAIIIPGMTLREIDDKLSGLGIIPKGSLEILDPSDLSGEFSFLRNVPSLEGFLMPDTYRFFSGSEPKEAAVKMLENFRQKAGSRFGLNFLGREDVVKIITLASLLEKEIPDTRDRRIAMGVLENRMREGMALQLDATVVYAGCGKKFSGCPPLGALDYKIDSPYNTYLYPGMPPSPIGSPGLDAIEAALEPIGSGYLYYLSDPKTKATIFSKTLDEHNRNRVKYLLNQ